MIYFVILIAYIATFLGYSFMKKVDEDKFFPLIKILLITTCAAVILLKDIAMLLILVSLFFLLGVFLNQKKFEKYIIKLKPISAVFSQIIFFSFIAFAISMIVGIPLAALFSVVSKNEKITLELMKVIYVTLEIIFGICVGMKLSKSDLCYFRNNLRNLCRDETFKERKNICNNTKLYFIFTDRTSVYIKIKNFKFIFFKNFYYTDYNTHIDVD